MARLPASVVTSFVVGVFSENVPLPSTRKPAAWMLPPVCVTVPPPTALSVTSALVWIVPVRLIPVPERLRSRMSPPAEPPPMMFAALSELMPTGLVPAPVPVRRIGALPVLKIFASTKMRMPSFPVPEPLPVPVMSMAPVEDWTVELES